MRSCVKGSHWSIIEKGSKHARSAGRRGTKRRSDWVMTLSGKCRAPHIEASGKVSLPISRQKIFRRCRRQPWTAGYCSYRTPCEPPDRGVGAIYSTKGEERWQGAADSSLPRSYEGHKETLQALQYPKKPGSEGEESIPGSQRPKPSVTTKASEGCLCDHSHQDPEALRQTWPKESTSSLSWCFGQMPKCHPDMWGWFLNG